MTGPWCIATPILADIFYISLDFGIATKFEEEKSKLNATIEGFKKENDKINESIRELEDILESKSTQVEYLRESLNNCNDKNVVASL